MDLRTEDTFADGYHWTELAKAQKVRLPLWRMPPTTGGMRKFLKKINRDTNWYLYCSGEKTLKEAVNNCGDWPLRAWSGICLEWLEEETTGKMR